ncbi:MAG: ABC transporter ATP-binding protein [Gammaproteobacteria bacterium]|nr:ABC transporter ATP-binding protein [Gammaproteobacteria bacterium]
MLEAKLLTKIYQAVPALDKLDLQVPAGEVFCLLGPNGAGKTTTVNLFLNFITPTSGQALVCGVDATVDPVEARRMLAYIPETVVLYGNLSGLENLEYFTTLSTGRRLDNGELLALLREAGLQKEAATRRVAGYSKGMRQKVGIAIALAKHAKALLLDEPTSGLDPAAANEFMRLIETLRKQGMAVLMVTHDLFLAKQCGNRIGIMQRGRLVTTFRTDDIDHIGLERTYLDISHQMEVA